jgi:hypothetical protein
LAWLAAQPGSFNTWRIFEPRVFIANSFRVTVRVRNVSFDFEKTRRVEFWFELPRGVSGKRRTTASE